MKRSDFLRLSALGSLGLATRGFAIPADYAGIPAGIRPYLQVPRPDSMVVSWWSDAATSGTIEWGTSAASLTNTVAAATNMLGTNYHYHSGKISGLSPASYYYYRVRNGSTVSDTFRFRTPVPLGTKTGRLRVVVMGDNQIINENRYEKMIAGMKSKIEALHGVPIEEAVDFFLMPGDQVDSGTLEQYRHLHFKQCGLVSPNLPIMTTVGNHETYGGDSSLSLYSSLFFYEGLNYGGVASPGGEKYYSYQVANVAFLHTSSEHTGTEQKQWVRNFTDVLKTDTATDLCVSVVHRPYQAEQYVGDISSWFRNEVMSILAETDKHVLNIGAHHHLYARGQTREWPVYHIISGGSAWDQYWGASTEVDMDDVQKTVANWAWQLLEFDLEARTMEVTCYAEANVRLPAATRWNYNSRLIDRFHRKLGLAAPVTPSFVNPPAGTITLPVDLVSTPFTTGTAEVLNSSWFQVADDAGFTSLKIDRIRDVENLYGDTGAPLYEPVDTHAGVNILSYPLHANSLPNGTYHARVRHRDSNALWSGWSAATSFTVQGSVITQPSLKLPKSVYALNEDIFATFEGGPGNARDWVAIYSNPLSDGGQPDGGPGSRDWVYVSGTRAAGAPGTTNGTVKFPSATSTYLTTGLWSAYFLANDIYTQIVPKVDFYVGVRPLLVPTEVQYDEGETARINFSSAPGGAKDWIGIYRVGNNPGPASPSVRWSYAAMTSGALDFTGLEKGYYYATYLLNDGYFEISERVYFSVGQLISTVTMASGEIQAGEDFTVSFTNGPGIPKDWIGIFKQGDVPGDDVLTAYLYFAGATAGSVTFQLPDLPPGDYFAAMFINDSYTEVSNRFLFRVLGKPDLEFESVELAGNEMRLRWKSVSGKTYNIRKSTTGLSGWITVRSVVATGASTEEIVSVDRIAEPSCFFRVTDD